MGARGCCLLAVPFFCPTEYSGSMKTGTQAAEARPIHFDARPADTLSRWQVQLNRQSTSRRMATSPIESALIDVFN